MLTKTELLNMSEDSYMNKKQYEFFEKILCQQKKDLILSISETRKRLSENENSSDISDLATKQEMQQIFLKTVERQSKLLQKVQKSIENIKNGTYGYCQETGEPIGIKRLLARPTATLSIQAKEAKEHHERTKGN